MALPELDIILNELLASKRRSRYGVAVTETAPDLSVISVEFRFLAGHSYCCAEPDCHLPSGCERLILLAAERSIHLPDDVMIRWHCVVEKGARLQCLIAAGMPAESDAYEFDAVSGSASVMKEASKMRAQKPPSNFSGLWTIEQSSGARTETEYVDGVPNGRFRYWHEHGTCLREGFKKNGQWHGKLITKNTDGTVLDVSEFNEGTGTYKIFNSKGQLTDEIPLRNGKAHGAAKRWCLESWWRFAITRMVNALLQTTRDKCKSKRCRG